MDFQTKILLLTFAITIVIAIIIIPILRRLKVGQMEREDGPESHLKKQGTPTMGGIIMMIAIAIVSIGAYLYYIRKGEIETAKNLVARWFLRTCRLMRRPSACLPKWCA